MEAMKGLFFPRVFSMVIFPFFYGLRLKDTLVSHPRPCGDGALWKIWAAGTSHAGGSSSSESGHSAAAVPVSGATGSPYSQYGTL
jgi:hypothetical protein